MNDKAVSPVIGIILMVAITVILAACIAAFLMSMTGYISIKEEDRISGTVIDRYSYDGQNLYITFRSYDPSGAPIDQTFWTMDPVLFHSLYSGENYTLITKPPGVTKYPQVIGVR